MKVLIGTDGSEAAITAARDGLAVLVGPDAIVLVTAITTPDVASAGLDSGFAGGLATPEEIDAGWVSVQREAEDILEVTAATLPTGVPVERRVEVGDAGPLLCRLAAELDIDVIIVGSRGRGAIRRALLGSVSSHVANHAPCVVTIVPVTAGER